MLNIARLLMLKLALLRLEYRLIHLPATHALGHLAQRVAYRQMDILQSKIRQLGAR